MNVTRVAFGPLKIFSSARAPAPRPVERRDGSFFGSVVRLPFVLAATAMLIAATIAACGVAFNVPGLIASGRFDPSIGRDIENHFRTSEWPRLMRFFGGMGMSVLALVGSVLLMLVRRHKGGLHMLRVVAGVALLLCSPFILAGPGVVWSPAAFTGRPDWAIALDDFMGRITTMHAIRAGVTFVAAILLLLWPAKTRWSRKSVDEPAASQPPPAAPPVAPGVGV